VKPIKYGYIKVAEKSYEIYNLPLSKELSDKVSKYKKSYLGSQYKVSMCDDLYSWSVVDGKLYLDEMNILTFDEELFIKLMNEADLEIFEEDFKPYEHKNIDVEDVEVVFKKGTVSYLKKELDMDKLMGSEAMNSLQRKGIKMQSVYPKNIINQLCGSDRVFASWYSQEIEALISKEEFELEGKNRLLKVKLNIYSFENGILQSEKEVNKEIKRGGGWHGSIEYRRFTL
jgi:hypothetical protein